MTKKRYLIHAAAYNLGLIMHALFGNGTPKGMADVLARLVFALFDLSAAIFRLTTVLFRFLELFWLRVPVSPKSSDAG
ncbi:hypothetical protein [Desulfolithobacter dissulfuricans]|nr:hypothetical protein [Desulfolithobacter dissulfuricans]